MINQRRLINTFLEIVQIDSPTNNEDSMARYVATYAKQLGYSPIEDNIGNVIITRPGKGQALLFTAHMDTVEPGCGIKPHINKDVIQSDGTTILGADNKVAVSVLLELLAVLSDKRIALRPLDFVFTRSEESGNVGAANLDTSCIRSKIGYSFDSGEPLGTVFIGSPFYDRFDITVTGKGAHASIPEAGNNALTAAQQLLHYIPVGRIDNNTIANIGVINGGSVRNTIPEKVQLQGEIRSFIQSTINTIGTKIQQHAQQVAYDTKTKIKVSIVHENPGYLLDKNNVLVKSAVHVLNKLHIPVVIKKTYACFDANVFQNHGITVLNMADGSQDNHTTRESIRVKDLQKLCKIACELALNNS